MPNTLLERRDAYLTAIDTILADTEPNASAEAYGVKYTRQDLTKLESIVARLNALLNRRRTGILTYGDLRGER